MTFNGSVNKFFGSNFTSVQTGEQWALRVIESPHLFREDEIKVYDYALHFNFFVPYLQELPHNYQLSLIQNALQRSDILNQRVKNSLLKYFNLRKEIELISADKTRVSFPRKSILSVDPDVEHIELTYSGKTLNLALSFLSGQKIPVEENFDELLDFADTFYFKDLLQYLADFAYTKLNPTISLENLKYLKAAPHHPEKDKIVANLKLQFADKIQFVEETEELTHITVKKLDKVTSKLLHTLQPLFYEVKLTVEILHPENNPELFSLFDGSIKSLHLDLKEYNDLQLFHLAVHLGRHSEITDSSFENINSKQILLLLYVHNAAVIKITESLIEALSKHDKRIQELKDGYERSKAIETLKILLPLITPELLRASEDGLDAFRELLKKIPELIEPFDLGNYYSYQGEDADENTLDIRENHTKNIIVDRRIAAAHCAILTDLTNDNSSLTPCYYFNKTKDSDVIAFGTFLQTGELEIKSLKLAKRLYLMAARTGFDHLKKYCFDWITYHVNDSTSLESVALNLWQWASENRLKLILRFIRRFHDYPGLTGDDKLRWAISKSGKLVFMMKSVTKANLSIVVKYAQVTAKANAVREDGHKMDILPMLGPAL